MIYYHALEDRLHISTLPAGRLRFLDVGYGTGIWSIEMKRKYPQADHVAIDIGNDQPAIDNVDFGVDYRSGVDFTTDNWGVHPGSFDFVHLGMLCGTVPDWAMMYERVHHVLKPGGIVEHIEVDWQPRCDDDSLPRDSPVRRWWDLMQQASAASGKHIGFQSDAEHLLRRACFTTVERRAIRITHDEESQAGNDEYQNNLAQWSRFVMFHPTFKTLNGLSMGLLTKNGMQASQVEDLLRAVTTVLNGKNSSARGVYYQM